MKQSLLQYIRCPRCLQSFELKTFRVNSKQEVQDGVLLCAACKVYYYVSHFIPRLLLGAYSDLDFSRRYAEEIKEIEQTYCLSYTSDKTSLDRLQQHTQRNFGHEWEMWASFGWEDERPSQKTKDIFDYKVLFAPEELPGKLLLDAGCGNGRYLAVAAEYGAIAIGIDLSNAVDIAFDHLGDKEDVHLIQGDLLHPPFALQIFDRIFSNGVLMHTGNARAAFHALVRHLNAQGAIAIHLYHKGNWLYEFNDAALRFVFTRVPLSWAHLFSRMWAKLAQILPQGQFMNVINGVVRLEAHPHYVFDWYTAPIATHHTYPEVYQWLKEENLYLVEDHNQTGRPWVRKLFPFLFMTVKAQVQPMNEPAQHTIR